MAGSPALKKRLGQHHLVEAELCRPLIEFLRPAGERVLEIGPGGGVLTEQLLIAGARVIACEFDLEWAGELHRRLRRPELRIAVADALRLDPRRLPSPTLVAGNLPFNVATPILEAFLPCHAVVPRAAFMVQEEVAARLVARPGDRAYGSFSVLVASWAASRRLGTVRPGSFRPPPKVSAAFVGFLPRPPPVPEAEMPDFVRLVRLAFAQRRKTLRNALGQKLGRERAAGLVAALSLDARCRAESLDLDDFVELYRQLKASRIA